MVLFRFVSAFDLSFRRFCQGEKAERREREKGQVESEEPLREVSFFLSLSLSLPLSKPEKKKLPPFHFESLDCLVATPRWGLYPGRKRLAEGWGRGGKVF